MVCLLTASPAQAWLGDGWLERLSGPGPFHPMFILDARLVCIAGREAPLANEIDPADLKKLRWNPDGVVSPSLRGCHFLDRDAHRLELGVQFTPIAATGPNLLDYTHRPEALGLDKDVHLKMLLVTADWRINRVFDFGVGLGRAYFSSEDELFADFSKGILQPIRVTTRPVRSVIDHRNAEFVVLRADATIFLGGFTDADFGARPGSFNDPGELVWSVAAILDFSVFLWRDSPK
jgi:hypothetical protein